MVIKFGRRFALAVLWMGGVWNYDFAPPEETGIY
jgi:hypothetical protein